MPNWIVKLSVQNDQRTRYLQRSTTAAVAAALEAMNLSAEIVTKLEENMFCCSPDGFRAKCGLHDYLLLFSFYIFFSLHEF